MIRHISSSLSGAGGNSNVRRPACKHLFLAFAVLAGLFAILIPHTVQAQIVTADVLGTVTDPSGAVVPDAQVTIVNVNTGIKNTAKSDNLGQYLFSHLQVGAYKLTVTAPGFKTFVQDGLTVYANDRARVDAKLAVGNQVQTVEVDMTAAPELKTDTDTLDTTLTTTAVSSLPLNGLNIQNLVQLSAGVNEGASNAPAGAQGFNGHTDDLRPTSAFSANGMNDMYNNQLIDGMDNNERSIGTQVLKPALDAIDQVVVMTDLYPAEYGRSVGGVMNVITKAGGNKFHGDLYEFVRNDILDAYTYNLPTAWVTNPSKGEYRQNQFGGSFSGPIRKDKVFFFGDYEGFRMIDAVGTSSGTVPGSDIRNLVTAAGVGNPVTFYDPIFQKTVTVPKISQLGMNLFNLFPAFSGPTALEDFTGHPKDSQFFSTFDGRIDDHITQNDLLFGRFSYNKTTTGIGYAFNPITINSMSYNNTLPVETTTQGLAIDWTHTISASMLFELKAGYTRFVNNSGVTSGVNAASNIGFATCTGVSSATNPVYCINSPYGGANEGLPSINLENYGLPSGPSTGIGDGAWSPLHNTSQAYQYAASLIWNRGSHSMKFGAELIRRQLSRLQSPSARGSYGNNALITGSSIGDLLMGIASSVQQQTVVNFPQFRSWEPGVYAQDDWRLYPWLTLNLGIRYDIYTPYVDKHGQLSNFNEQSGILQSPALVGIYQGSNTGDVITDFANIAPRIGFSASLPYQMVLRGGGGISYFTNEQGGGTGVSMANFPYSWSVDYGGDNYNTAVPSAMSYYTAAEEIAAGQPTTCTGNTTSPMACAVNLVSGITEPYLSADTVMNLPIGTEIDGVENNLRPGRVVQYSLQLQKQFQANVISLGYIGNSGRHMPVVPDINQAAYATASGQGPQPYTSATTLDGQNLTSDSIYETSSDATSNYNAMQVVFTRRISQGLMVDANYTWSKVMSNGSPQGEGGTRPVECVRSGCIEDMGNGSTQVVSGFKQYDWGLGDINVHHRIAIMSAYKIPVSGNLNGPLGYLAKNWNLSGIWVWNTSNPQSVAENGPVNISGITGWRGGDAPDQTGNANSGPKKLTEWFDTSVFAVQTPYTLGNAQRNSVQGPNLKHLDLSLTKDFPLYQETSLQLRADAFNATNTPSFGTPNVAFQGPTFGEITSMANAYNPREFQLSVRLSF